MKSKHTPGPWLIEYDDDGNPLSIFVQDVSERGEVISECGLWIPQEQWVDDFLDELSANFRLTAAAPDMLEALEAYVEADEAVQGFDQTSGIGGDIMAQAKAAIAKARGEEEEA